MLSAANVNRNGGSGDKRGDLSSEELFDVLSNRRRRFVVHALKRAKETGEIPVGISELSTRVTAWELGISPEDVCYDDRRNVQSTLRRTHLPMLEERNVVAVDEEDGSVRPTPTLGEFDIYVEVLQRREIPWSLYYVGLSVALLCLFLAVLVNAPIVGSLSSLPVAVFAATTLEASALAHYVINRRMALGDTEEPPEVCRQA